MAINIDFGTLDLDTTNNITVKDISLKDKNTSKVTAIPKTDGGVMETSRRISITVTANGDIAGTSFANLLANIDTLRSGLNQGKQKFQIDDDRYLYAQMNAFSIKYKKLTNFATWKASFLANYPYWVKDTASSDSRAPTSGVGYNITNNGNAPARVKFIITAAGGAIVDDCLISNTTTGEGFAYRGTIANTKALEVDNRYDTDDFEVLNDGTDDHVNYEGDFITLNPGVNEIKFTGVASTTVAISWRDTWY